MTPRFYAPDAHAAAIVTLPADEAAHLTRVLRLGRGDAVRVFNGRGGEWRGQVAAVSRAGASVELTDAVAPAPEPRVAIRLAIAVLKGDKMDDVVRDAVMLGVAAIVPVITERTAIALRAVERGHRVERWQRIAVSSTKQCGRAVVPTIQAPRTFADLLLDPAPRRLLLVEPDAAVPGVRLMREVTPADALDLLVGPEGGWTPAEVTRAAQSGCILVTLGALTLRADAVPLVALTAIRTIFDDLS